jgi:uncharacterized phage protein (TIGR02218 family)
MKTPTNIDGNNLVTWLQSATEIRMADLYTITLAGGFTGTRIQSSGGSNVLKYYWDAGLGTLGVQYNISVAVKNQGLAPIIISCQYANSSPIAPGVTQAVSFTITGSGALDVQLRFHTNAISDALDVIASDPIIQQVGGANLITASHLDFSAWNSFGGAVITLTQNQPAPQSVLRYTTWDSTLVVLGNTFLTGPPNFQRTAIEEKLGMDVSTIELTIQASATDLVNGVPILQAIGLGLFDGAAFKIERLFMDSTGIQIGTVIRFSGFIGPVNELSRSYAKIDVEAGTKLLQMQLPAVILQPGCTNTLFDARCGLVKASFAESNVVQAGSTVNKLLSLSAKADAYYDNGQIAFTSGVNAGLVKAVKSYAAQQFTFNSPLPFAATAGDAFIAYPGCDKTQATCTNKFSNLVNFEGFPYVPAPETAI